MRPKTRTVRKPRQSPEFVLQKSFFQWLRWAHRDLYETAFAIPNGGLRNVIVAKKLKAEGVKAGVPDVLIAYPVSIYHGLFIEFKAGKNKPTKEQLDMIEKLRKRGYHCAVCYNIDHAMDLVDRYVLGVDNILKFKGDNV